MSKARQSRENLRTEVDQGWVVPQVEAVQGERHRAVGRQEGQPVGPRGQEG